MRRFASIALVVVAAFALSAAVMSCSGGSTASSSSGPLTGPAPRPTPAYSPLANGRSIFQTGKDQDGVQIVAQPQAMFSSCEACHRADGSGGKKFGDGAVSADLRHRALVIEQRHPYTLALLERAISTGVDNEGQKLDRVMPHWRLSKRDLHDVAQYVLLDIK